MAEQNNVVIEKLLEKQNLLNSARRSQLIF